MSKFDRVLSDDELWAAAAEVEWQGTIGQYRLIEQAVLAKLAEQEPVAWRVWLEDLQCWSYSCDYHGCGEPLYAHPCVSPTSDKTACVSENAKGDTQHHLSYLKRYQKWRRGEDKTMDEAGLTPKQIGETLDWLITFAENHIEEALELARNQPCGCIVCYCENQERCLGCGAKYCGTHEVGEIPNPVYVGHIPDVSKMVFDPDAALTLAERTVNLDITERLADELIQFARKLHEKYAQADHIPDGGKMITPLAQRKIQTLLDKGEYRVIENATVLVNENGHAAIVNHGGAFYWVDNEGLAREFDAAGAENTGE